jgi:hypothetical protein
MSLKAVLQVLGILFLIGLFAGGIVFIATPTATSTQRSYTMTFVCGPSTTLECASLELKLTNKRTGEVKTLPLVIDKRTGSTLCPPIPEEYTGEISARFKQIN